MRATILTVCRNTMLAGLCLGLVQAAAVKADDDNDDHSSREKLTPQKFVEKVAWSGQKEVQLSELALQKAQDAEVKRFAHRMIRDHSQVSRQLTQLAQSKGWSLPASNAFARAVGSGKYRSQAGTDTTRPDIDSKSEHETQPQLDRTQIHSQIPEAELEAFRKLQSTSGSAFDRAYISEMRKDHEKTIAKFEKADQSLDDSDLKEFVSDTLPKLREHNRMAEQLAQSIGAKY